MLVLGEESVEDCMERLVLSSGGLFQTIIGNSPDRLVLVVDMHVKDREECEWVTLDAICFNSCAYGWLTEN